MKSRLSQIFQFKMPVGAFRALVLVQFGTEAGVLPRAHIKGRCCSRANRREILDMYFVLGMGKNIDEMVGEERDAQILYTAVCNVFPEDVPPWKEMHERLQVEDVIKVNTKYCEIEITRQDVRLRRKIEGTPHDFNLTIYHLCRVLAWLPEYLRVRVLKEGEEVEKGAQTNISWLLMRQRKALPVAMEQEIERANVGDLPELDKVDPDIETDTTM